MKNSNPFVYIVLGQPGNGKTTISHHISARLQCPIIHTDDTYLEWVANTHRNHLTWAKKSIRRHYNASNDAFRNAWLTYLEQYLLAAINEHDTLVIEGWLLLKTPKTFRKNINAICTTVPIYMKRFVAYVNGKTFSARDKNYSRAVAGITQFVDKHMVGLRRY